jgi:hypothetical protein
MPRYQPPKEYYTATQVKEILNISGAMIANYVEKGKIKHIVPTGRKHGYYLKKDVDKLSNELNAFFNLEEEADKTVFTTATKTDIPECIKLNKDLFGKNSKIDEKNLTSKWQEWIQKNPEVVYILKNSKEVLGIITIIPVKPNSKKFEEVLSADTSILLGDVNISSEDIEEYKEGNHVQLYIAEIGVKPSLEKFLRRKYGARIISKAIDTIVSLGSRRVIIEDITSVGETKSGIKILQHLGFCEIDFHRTDTRLFKLDIMKSVAPVALSYRKAIEEATT